LLNVWQPPSPLQPQVGQLQLLLPLWAKEWARVRAQFQALCRSSEPQWSPN